ncbi:dienelactone hydrolase family protein [Brachybacterium sp. JHP9]|uniref:Dienelactone hydrolase family protein n=1 Tax=Brachybacterium equifaecis TaxID=2910770 RepID=A0ABT0R065_9MICO|nr:dienelactone hydrolase family protein [Brachybacterium equifaecis]MCL6422853.1 dienelactone hydrolase family protein [Brachybacterium equifaecis]
MTATSHTIPTDSGDLPGLLWLPADAPAAQESGDLPGIVVLQEIFGLSDYVQQRCQDLADLGYAVLAPQLFARLEPPVVGILDPETSPASAPGDLTGEDDEAFQDWLQDGMDLTSQLPWGRAEADALAALEALRELGQVDAERVALMGFCYGGGLAFSAAVRAAREGRAPRALVSFYGSALPGLLELAPEVEVPSFHAFGTADAFIPLEQVEQIREAVTAGGKREQVRFELYEGAGHAFDNPHPGLHHPVASREAWADATAFLRETLRG